ncbi:hypothetical protein ACFYZN_36450 [Streptomyces sp. NPDC001777]|uniref:hypothetical protein n=1 Tax=Streptomyces sp. NPDC001777 TaxID=3364608 RepID=UPI0036AB2696
MCEIGVMLTPSEARNLLVAYFVEHPPAISGELYIAPEWYEDAVDYLPVWGAREFLVDGRAAFGPVGQPRDLQRQVHRRGLRGLAHAELRQEQGDDARRRSRMSEGDRSMLDAAIERFIDQVRALTPESLATAFDRMVDLRAEGGKEASRAAVPSAAENSELDHRIRTALLSRAAELDAHLARQAGPGQSRNGSRRTRHGGFGSIAF